MCKILYICSRQTQKEKAEAAKKPSQVTVTEKEEGFATLNQLKRMVVPQQLKFPGEGGDVIQELTPPSGSSTTLSSDGSPSVSSMPPTPVI